MICEPLYSERSDASEVFRELSAGVLAKRYRLNTADGKLLTVAVAADSDAALVHAEQVLHALDGQFKAGQRIPGRASA